MPNMPQPGADWAGYRIDEQIGLGGRGQVYVAFDALLRKPVAIKALADMPSDDPVGERFCRVPVAAADLGHDGIIRVHNTSDVDGAAFVVMDWFPGGSLDDEIAVSTLTLQRVRSVLGQVAAALDEAHGGGLPHCNVKPTNILIHEDGRRVVLTDFGSTRFADEARSDRVVPPDERARLPFYEAPEVLLGEVAGPAADVYSLGAVLYTALTGRVPFPGDVPGRITEQHLTGAVPRLTDVRDDLATAFDGLIGAAMAKDPGQRPPSGSAFIDALDEAIAAPAPEGPRSRPSPTGAGTGPDRAGSGEGDGEGEHLAVPALDDGDGPGTGADQPEATDGSGGERGDDGRAGMSAVASEADADSDDDTEQHPVPLHLPDRSSVYRGARQAKRDLADWRLPDGSVDGAALDVYEDEPRRRWLTLVVVVLLVVAVAVVGWLVWRAVDADSESTVDAEAEDSGLVVVST